MDNIKVIYFWYDHLVLRENGDDKIVTKAIQTHDFDTFIKYYNKYPPFKVTDEEFGELTIPYFPNTALIFDGDEIIGTIDITIKKGFEKITDSEYECG